MLTPRHVFDLEAAPCLARAALRLDSRDMACPADLPAHRTGLSHNA
jgi:hypothetical protein